MCHFNDKTFNLPLYVSFHLCPLTETPYFVRFMTPNITIILSRMIMMYFDPDEVGDFVLAINIPHSLCLTLTHDKIVDISKVLSCFI